MSEENKTSFFTKIKDKIKKIKHLDIILTILFIAVILLIYFSSFASNSNGNSNNSSNLSSEEDSMSSYSNALTDKIESLISSISNAGQVKVLLIFSQGIKTEIAYTTETKTLSDGTKVETKTPILITNNGSNETVILQEILPAPSSIIVVASGAKDTNVKLDILRLIQAMFDLPTSKIEIFA